MKLFDSYQFDDEKQKIIMETLQSLLEADCYYEIINMLLFNNLDFEFIFLAKPEIRLNGKGNYLHLAARGLSFLKPEYGTASFTFEPMSELQKYINHPEHITAYLARYKDQIFGEYFYNRGNADYSLIIGRLVMSFMVLTHNYTLDSIRKLIEDSFRIRKRTGNYGEDTRKIADTSFFSEDFYLKSFENRKDTTIQSLRELSKIYIKKYCEIENKLFFENYFLDSLNLYVIGEGYNKNLYYEASIPRPKRYFTTDLSKKIAIISKNDNIADLLYRLAVDCEADSFKAAVGYAYESGLKQLVPTLEIATRSSVENEIRYFPADLVVGRLQKYQTASKIKDINKNTAKYLQYLQNDNYIFLYTYPDSFYHGKFYYLSGKNKSYVIMGSSNITKSAFETNYEFDILYCFDKCDSNDNRLELDFLEWFDGLKSNCVKLGELNLERFATNTYSDENGGRKGDSFFRTLTSEEEQHRYDLLMSFNPSDFLDKPFKTNPHCYPFRNAVAFIYEERNILLLEEFTYGRACYVFSANSVKAIIPSLMGKSKLDIKRNNEVLISVIEHNEQYAEKISELFSSNNN